MKKMSIKNCFKGVTSYSYICNGHKKGCDNPSVSRSFVEGFVLEKLAEYPNLLIYHKILNALNHRQERVELHLHTNMSAAGVSSAKELILQTAEYGQTAIAITDNSTVQAFPEAYRTALEEQYVPLHPFYHRRARNVKSFESPGIQHSGNCPNAESVAVLGESRVSQKLLCQWRICRTSCR